MKSLIFVAILLIGAETATAQSIILNTDAANNPTRGRWGYKKRKRDYRAEGFYNKNMAEYDFPVVSFLRRPLHYQLLENEVLNIYTFPVRNFRDSIKIAGVNFNFNPGYHLDFRTLANRTSHVPIKDVILHGPMPYFHLGIYGYTGNINSPGLFIPVDASPEISNKNIEPYEGPYLLSILTTSDVSDVSWTYAIEHNGFTQGSITGGTINSGEAISNDKIILIPLKFNADVKSGDIVRIKITALKPGLQKPTEIKNIRLLIPLI